MTRRFPIGFVVVVPLILVWVTFVVWHGFRSPPDERPVAPPAEGAAVVGVEPEPGPMPRETAFVPDFWRHPVWRVYVWDRSRWDAAEDGDRVPLMQVGFWTEAELRAGYRMLVWQFAPRRDSPVIGFTVFDVAKDGWVDPHTLDAKDRIAPTWVEAEVKVGLGIY